MLTSFLLSEILFISKLYYNLEDLMLNILDIIRERRSVRAFRDRQVSEELIDLLVEAACCAPSAGNRQPWEFVIVKDSGIKLMLADAALGQSFVSEAPVVFVVCALPEISGSRYGNRGCECKGDRCAGSYSEEEGVCSYAPHIDLFQADTQGR